MHDKEWLKRMAAQIASQLPEDQVEALQVLRWAGDIVTCLGSRHWIDGARKERCGTVVRLFCEAPPE